MHPNTRTFFNKLIGMHLRAFCSLFFLNRKANDTQDTTPLLDIEFHRS